MAVWCSQDERWKRIQKEYAGLHSDFTGDDERDKNEELPYGQQVQLCVDSADIVISNEEFVSSKPGTVRALKNKIAQYLELLHGRQLRTPNQAEAAMAIAYTSSLRSLCIKRQVGAVIADNSGRVISVGYNENPEPVAPCIKQFNHCYKDDWLHSHIDSQIQKHDGVCFKCKTPLSDMAVLGETYRCPNPSCKTSFVRSFAPDRGMSRCTAIHAENMAIMNAGGRDLEGTILYTTTFPCAQCARQIVYAGIGEVVYVEPYPDPDSVRFFEGVQ